MSTPQSLAAPAPSPREERTGRGLGRARTGDIADTLDRGHHLHFAWFGLAVAIDRRTQTARILVMQLAQEHMIKGDAPDPAPLAAQAQQMPDEGLADKTASALPADFPVAANPADGPSGGIPGWLRSPVEAAAAVKMAGWRGLGQSLMRAGFIVMPQPAGRARLLGGATGGGRAGRVRLKFTMPLFMRAIVLRAGRAGTRPRSPA